VPTAKFIQKLLGYVKSEILDATTTILLFMVEKSLALAHDMVPKLLKSNCQASSVDLVLLEQDGQLFPGQDHLVACAIYEGA